MNARSLRVRSLVAGLGALITVALAACGGPSYQTARPDPVALSSSLGVPINVGVVISSSSQPGQGAEWRGAAEGAQVAVRRFALGGTTVQLTVRNDNGTTAGASAAVRALVAAKVSGIVVASSGSHLEDALAEATAAKTPVLLPYEDSATLPTGAWRTGPARSVEDTRLVEELKRRDLTRTLLIDAGAGTITGLRPIGTLRYASGDDLADLAKTLRTRQTKDDQRFDSVVVSGPAALQAAVISTLQSSRIDVPYLVTAQAQSPAFAAALVQAGGSLATSLTAAGLNTGDSAALDPDANGRALAAYFAALRMLAADPNAKDLLGEDAFAGVAPAADVRSHDAVVALVRAAEALGNSSPDRVSIGLSSQTVDGAKGLAGPTLNFSTADAINPDSVLVLQSTPESPGVRPAPTEAVPQLYWFARPAA